MKEKILILPFFMYFSSQIMIGMLSFFSSDQKDFFSIVTVNYTYRKSQIDLSKEKNLKTEG